MSVLTNAAVDTFEWSLISRETGKAVALMAKLLLKVERGMIAVVMIGQ